MNGSQWDQSRFTVGGGGSKAYDEGFERTLGDKKTPAATAPCETEAAGTRPEPPRCPCDCHEDEKIHPAEPAATGLVTQREARAANDAIFLRAAVLALLKTVENGWRSAHGDDSQLWRELESVQLAEKAIASDGTGGIIARLEALAAKWERLADNGGVPDIELRQCAADLREQLK